jgi:hypothetical protein
LLVIISCYASCATAFKSSISDINPGMIKEMLSCSSYSEGCLVPPVRLRKVNFSYYDFDMNINDSGTIIVMDAVAEHVEQIFKELYQIKFPIHKAVAIEAYGGDDVLSLEDNNSSSFNCRQITGSSSIISIHSYGLAIDINPIQNPYVDVEGNHEQQGLVVLPKEGRKYLNRTKIRAGMAEQVEHIFKKHGFTIWGGNWNTPIDWQHFQPSRLVAQILSQMDSTDAKEIFNLYAGNPYLFNNATFNQEEFIDIYKKDKLTFMKIFRNSFKELSKLEAKLVLKNLPSKIDEATKLS